MKLAVNYMAVYETLIALHGVDFVQTHILLDFDEYCKYNSKLFIIFRINCESENTYWYRAIFTQSCKSWVVGLKNLGPLRFEPKKTHPPTQPHRIASGPTAHKNHNFLARSS